MTGPVSLTFAAPSVLSAEGLTLQTSLAVVPRGRVAHPRFFDGFLVRPQEGARCLLAVADVARTSYHQRSNWVLLDPVVTADGEALRFESFSGCGGVHARWDVLPDGLDGDTLEHGTTNVDINDPLRLALTRVSPREPLHLSVGASEVAVTTLDAAIVEKKVALPGRWVRGFAEAPLATVDMRPVARLGPAEARTVLRSLPRRAGRALWVVSSGSGLRVTTQYRPDAACLAGPHRLAELEPLLRHATALTVYAAPTEGHPVASAWQLDLAGSRLTLTLSPSVDRGFSGEGGVLGDLAASESHALAERVLEVLAWAPGSDPETIAFALADSDVDAAAVRRALTVLGTSGVVGFDLATGRYHHRVLPFDPQQAEKANPRLVKARSLVPQIAAQGAGVWQIDRGDHAQQVRRTADGGWSCSCRWWRQFPGSRGPCSHVLAVQLSDG